MSDNENITKPVRLEDLVYVRTYIDTRQDELRTEIEASIPETTPTPHKLILSDGNPNNPVVEFDGSEEKTFTIDLSDCLTSDDKTTLETAINSKASNLALDELTARVEANENAIGTLEGGGVTVVDNLESTSTTQALSANQGRILNETMYELNNTQANTLVDLDARVVINKNDIATNKSSISNKIDKVSGAVGGNIPRFSNSVTGALADSGVPADNILQKYSLPLGDAVRSVTIPSSFNLNSGYRFMIIRFFYAPWDWTQTENIVITPVYNSVQYNSISRLCQPTVTDTYWIRFKIDASTNIISIESDGKNGTILNTAKITGVHIFY